jgi:hypothetical protein
MKLPKILERQIVKLVLSRSGPYVQKLITLGAAAGAAAVAKQVPGLEDIITPELLGLVLWVILDSVVTNLPGEILTKYGKEIQSTYNAVRPKAFLPPLAEDGFVGPLTARNVTAELLIGQEPQPLTEQ